MLASGGRFAFRVVELVKVVKMRSLGLRQFGCGVLSDRRALGQFGECALSARMVG